MELKNKVLIIGLGNPLITDDAVGLLIIDELENASFQMDGVSFKKNYSGGVDLIYDLARYQKVIVVDAIATNNPSPGKIHKIDLEDLKDFTNSRIVDSHGVNLMTVIELGKTLGYHMPEEISILGIEGKNFTDFSEVPTEKVYASIGNVIKIILEMLIEWDIKINDEEVLNYFKNKQKTEFHKKSIGVSL